MPQKSGCCLLVLLILFSAFLPFIKASTSSIGTSKGDIFVYNRAYFFTSNGPTIDDIGASYLLTHNITSLRYEIIYSNDFAVNFTENSIGHVVILGGPGGLFYLTGLNPNDKLYPASGSELYRKVIVNETLATSFPNGQRLINHANYTLDYGQSKFRTNFNSVLYEDVFFDKNTGMATHVESLNTYTSIQDPSKYCTLNSVSDLIESSVWVVGPSNSIIANPSPSVPELPASIAIGFLMTLVGSHLLVRQKKLNKKRAY
jgi:hypothetical protein